MKADKYFFLVVGILCVILLIIPTGFENHSITQSTLYEKALVLETDNSDIKSISITTLGTQNLKIVVKTGKFKHDTLSVHNILVGQKKIDKLFSPGDHALVVLQLNESHDSIVSARASDFYRQELEIILFVCFALFLILFAKLIGLKAILSFIFTAIAFWKLLIPFYLKGFNPLLVSFGVVILTTVVIILLIGGISRKGIVALLGTVCGISFTALLAIIFGYFFKIPGTVQDYSESLLYTGFMHLDMSNIFISGIFISAAGAVMDVSMDISASQDEIIKQVPDLSRRELMQSGFRIAAPVVGSMTTTLLFAYSGSFIFAFMAFMAIGKPFVSIVNTSYISAEILHTLVGSFGLVLVAPITAIIGGFIYTKKKCK